MLSKARLDLCWLRDQDKGKVKAKVFANTAEGCEALWAWMEHQTGCQAQARVVVLEATGVYHERITYWLNGPGVQARLVQPQQFHHFVSSFGVRGKTDRRDSHLLARYGQQGYGRIWEPEAPEIRRFKALLSRFEALAQDIRRDRESARESTDQRGLNGGKGLDRDCVGSPESGEGSGGKGSRRSHQPASDTKAR